MNQVEARAPRDIWKLGGSGHQRLFPPVRLDHVLVSQHVVPLGIREGVGKGSDHKPVIVDLALMA